MGSVRSRSSRFGLVSVRFVSIRFGSPVLCSVPLNSVRFRFDSVRWRFWSQSIWSDLLGSIRRMVRNRFGFWSESLRFGRDAFGLCGAFSLSHTVYMFYHRTRALLQQGSRSFGYLLACCSCCSICLFSFLPFLILSFPGGCSVHSLCTYRSSYVYLADLRAVFVCTYHTV